ncbi:unnamed protein product, partial [Musa banksii]
LATVSDNYLCFYCSSSLRMRLPAISMEVIGFATSPPGAQLRSGSANSCSSNPWHKGLTLFDSESSTEEDDHFILCLQTWV